MTNKKYLVEKMSSEIHFIKDLNVKKGNKFLKFQGNKKMEEAYFFMPNINLLGAFNSFIEENNISNGNIDILKSFTSNNTICNKERCKLCSEYCYCEKARFYQNNMSSRLNILLAYLKDSEAMKISINKQLQTLRGKKINIVRIHTEGDFFSQQYVDFWIDIAKSNPMVKFYSYTKQFEYFQHIEALPSNFYLQISFDTSSEYKMPFDLLSKGNVNIFLTYHEKNKDDVESFVSSYNLQNMVNVDCKGKCKNCQNCYTNKGKIHLCKIH